MTAWSILGNDRTTVAHFSFKTFTDDSWQNCSSSTRLAGASRCTAIFTSLQRCWVQVRTLAEATEFSQSHTCGLLEICFGSLFSWNVNLGLSLRSWALWKRFSLRITLLLCNHLSLDPNKTPSLCHRKTSTQHEAAPPCWTVDVVLTRWCSVPASLHTRCWELWPHSSISVRSENFASRGLRVVQMPFGFAFKAAEAFAPSLCVDWWEKNPIWIDFKTSLKYDKMWKTWKGLKTFCMLSITPLRQPVPVFFQVTDYHVEFTRESKGWREQIITTDKKGVECTK